MKLRLKEKVVELDVNKLRYRVRDLLIELFKEILEYLKT